MRAKVYRCRGWAAYDGHCGAADCETCHPGTAQAYVDHENGDCEGWPRCESCDPTDLCSECGDHEAEARCVDGRLWCLVCAEDCCEADWTALEVTR